MKFETTERTAEEEKKSNSVFTTSMTERICSAC